ncbi:PREDICTED: uncharacterized protein LOC108773291, partial [Cyphomyrmex costatus]|uniref:uncharacterized protein LOC108773291 n=1 Tax=Cyphomyrmex costatus TaxID=456900 RepID=UPI0008522478
MPNDTHDYSKIKQLTEETILKICPPSCLPNPPSEFDIMKEEDELNDHVLKELESPVTMEHLDLAIASVNKKSAPGLDRISNSMLSHLPFDFKELLVNLFNRFLEEGVVPEEWKRSLVIFIPKPGGSGVRPISLLSCVLKVFEKIIYWRLMWLVESQVVLPNEQMGFRPNRSCNDSLVTFTNQICLALSNNAYTVAVFLDIAVAFDNVLPSAVLEELKSSGVPASIRKLVENLISERHVQFLMDGSIGEAKLSRKGTPQGSTLSPLLFNIALCKLNACINGNVNFLQYADDIVLFSSDSSPLTAASNIQKALYDISAFLEGKGLTLSPSKSNWMVFTAGRRTPIPDYSLFIDSSLIPRVDKVRFLGVILDHRLIGNYHYEYLVKKDKALINIILSLTAVWWGSHPHCLLTIYRAIFRAAVEYACSIFSWKGNARVLLRLERLQYKAIRASMGYRISTPTNIILCEARELPFRLRFNLLSERFIFNRMSYSNSLVINSVMILECGLASPAKRAFALTKSPSLKCYIANKHEKLHMHRSYSIPALGSSLSAFMYRKDFDNFITYSKEACNNEIVQVFSDQLQNLRELVPDGLSFYTDGSKLEDGSVGAAFFSPELRHCFKYKLTSSSSVFSAEAWAIYQALILSLDAGYSTVFIFSDSRSVLEAVASHKLINSNYIIRKIKEALLQLAERKIVCSLFWIPSHKGIMGNEIADKAAKEACKDGAKGFSAYLNDKALSTGTQYHLLYNPAPSAKPWYYKFALNRSEIVLINRLRSNHYNLNYSLFRKNMVQSPACVCGDPRQDLNHIVFYCPLTRIKARSL